MKQEIKNKYNQVEVVYIAGVLNALASRWRLGKRYIREVLIAKDKLSERQENELLTVLNRQIEFQEQIKLIEQKHFESL